MPKKCHRLFRNLLDRPVSVVVTVGAREDDDAEFHEPLPFALPRSLTREMTYFI